MNATNAIPRLNNALGGRYETVREIGAGGMATVYLARDLKHQRNVALKVLKPELGAVLGVERFLAEIRVTANLQHPNLLPLFDSGEADGMLFYVMPFVEGETLRAKLDREKQLPIDEAIHIATAVASALEYAHKAGVIHRDLKPENILIQSGQPVIADFGIALAVSRAGGQRVTESGLSLGTPQYMSPEQATADRAIDARSDIYSLGAVTYEMLTGEPPHTGSTAQAIISRIMTETPRPVRTSRASVPVHVEQAVHTALSKLPADRFGDASRFSAALREERHIPARIGNEAAKPNTRLRYVWVAIPLALAAVFIAGKLSVGTPPPPRVLRFALKIPPKQAIVASAGAPIVFVPDGSAIVYVGRSESASGRMLYYRRFDQLEGVALAGTEGADIPTVSPSGEWVAFRVDSSIRKVPLKGGVPVVFSKVLGWGISWGANDVVFAGSPIGVFSVSASNGARRQVSVADTAGAVHVAGPYMPLALPDGKNVLGWARPSTPPGKPRVEQLVIVRIADGRLTYLDGNALNPVGFADGYLAFGRTDGTLGVIAFDPTRTTSVADVIPVPETPLTRNGGGASATLSAAGDLAYVKATDAKRLVHLDAQGRELAGRQDERNFINPRISPDGKRIVVAEDIGLRPGYGDLWIHDIASGALSPLSSTGASSNPSWTPDGQRVVFSFASENEQRELWSMPVDRSGPGERLVAMQVPAGYATISPDGRYAIVQTRTTPKTKQDLYSVDLRGDKTPVPLEQSVFNETEPAISPDGRWLAYVSDEGGSNQIYVRPFPVNGAHLQITVNGGVQPRWSKDSRAITYRRAEVFERALLAIGSTITVARRDSLFSGAYGDFDVAADGTIWALRPGNTEAEIMVVMNWIGELKARLAKK